jgi:DNA-binding NarL/FixJ family response regulator
MERPLDIRVLLIEPRLLWRDGLRYVLERDPRTSVVAGEWVRTRPAHLVERHTPDVLLIAGACFPGIRTISAASPVRVVIMADESEEPPDVVCCRIATLVAAGVRGIISERDSGQTVVEVICGVINAGGVWASPLVAATVAAGAHPVCPAAAPISVLSACKRDLLVRIAGGQTNDEICHDMAIATAALRTRLSSLYRAIDVRTRSEAVAYAWATGVCWLDTVRLTDSRGRGEELFECMS